MNIEGNNKKKKTEFCSFDYVKISKKLKIFLLLVFLILTLFISVDFVLAYCPPYVCQSSGGSCSCNASPWGDTYVNSNSCSGSSPSCDSSYAGNLGYTQEGLACSCSSSAGVACSNVSQGYPCTPGGCISGCCGCQYCYDHDYDGTETCQDTPPPSCDDYCVYDTRFYDGYVSGGCVYPNSEVCTYGCLNGVCCEEGNSSCHVCEQWLEEQNEPGYSPVCNPGLLGIMQNCGFYYNEELNDFYGIDGRPISIVRGRVNANTMSLGTLMQGGNCESSCGSYDYGCDFLWDYYDENTNDEIKSFCWNETEVSPYVGEPCSIDPPWYNDWVLGTVEENGICLMDLTPDAYNWFCSWSFEDNDSDGYSEPCPCSDSYDGGPGEPNCQTWMEDSMFENLGLFDCDGDNSNKNPGQPEICDDGIDNDCDWGIDDLDCDDCYTSCDVSNFDDSVPYFEIRNNAGVTITKIDQNGMMIITGTIQSWSTSYDSNHDFLVKNSSGTVVSWIDDASGDLYLNGSLNIETTSSPSSSGNLVVNNSSASPIAWFDSSGNLDLASCLAEGYTPPGYCGDGVVNQPGEDCDGSDLNGQTCLGLGYDSGTLSCTGSCTFDTSSCESVSVILHIGGATTMSCNEVCMLEGLPCVSVGTDAGGTNNNYAYFDMEFHNPPDYLGDCKTGQAFCSSSLDNFPPNYPTPNVVCSGGITGEGSYGPPWTRCRCQ